MTTLPLDTTIGHLLRRSQQVHTSMWIREFNGDLTGPQYALLSALTLDSVVDQKTAGQLASLDKSTAADVIARLERNGWLARDRHPSDGRRYLLALTAPARSALHQITPRVGEVQLQLLKALDPEDRAWFTETLARVAYGGSPPAVRPHGSSSMALPLPTTPGHLIRRSEQLHGVHWAHRVGSALTPPQYGLLSALAWNSPIDQGTAGDLASLDKSSTTDVMSRLRRRGLIVSAPDRRDRRRKILMLTEEARIVLDELTPAVALVQRDVTAPLEGNEADRLVELLRVIAYQ